MKKKTVALVALSVATLGSAVSGKGSANELRRLQNAALAYAKSDSNDEFSEPPRAGSALGASFNFVVPLNSSRSNEGVNGLSSGFYEYAGGHLTTYLHHWFGPIDAFEPAKIIPLGSYPAETAFGRHMVVRRERIEKVGVSITNVELSNVRNASDRQFRVFPYTIDVSGPEARALASSLHYEIKGKIHAFADGRSTACKTARSSPTLDRPVKFTFHSCTVAVVASRIMLVDTRTDTIMKVWEQREIASALQR